ncbi:MAG: hypothetical protein OEV42_13110 [Deltaproteobacteria bacterium]|nr:hypothetical protein [Deltaproteobacteria bacterium]
MSETETIKDRSFLYSNLFRPILLMIGALSILLAKGYVSAKLLLGLIFLDYFTTNLVNKLPVPFCFAIFVILTILAVT